VINTYNYPPYEGDYKIVHNGGWVNNKREGFGMFSIYDGTKYFGNWTNNHLTCERGTLELRYEGIQRPQDPVFFQTGMRYQGPVYEGLMNGNGTVTTNYPGSKNAILYGEFKDGVMLTGENITLNKGKSLSFLKIDNTRNGNSLTCRFILRDIDSKKGKIYKWDGYSLTEGDRLISKIAVIPSSPEEMELELLLRCFCSFEQSLLDNQYTEENFKFDSFDIHAIPRFLFEFDGELHEEL